MAVFLSQHKNDAQQHLGKIGGKSFLNSYIVLGNLSLAANIRQAAKRYMHTFPNTA